MIELNRADVITERIMQLCTLVGTKDLKVLLNLNEKKDSRRNLDLKQLMFYDIELIKMDRIALYMKCNITCKIVNDHEESD